MNPVSCSVQASESPPQRPHTTTNRTKMPRGGSDTTEREATTSKRGDNNRRVAVVSISTGAGARANRLSP